MRWFHSASVMPDGTCFRRASAGDMARFLRKIVDFGSEPSPVPDGQQGGPPAWQSCYRGYAPLRRRNCQQGRDAAAADIVDACEHDIVTLDVHHDGCGQALPVELG